MLKRRDYEHLRQIVGMPLQPKSSKSDQFRSLRQRQAFMDVYGIWKSIEALGSLKN